MTKGTAIVTSVPSDSPDESIHSQLTGGWCSIQVPSDSPDDYAAFMDMKNAKKWAHVFLLILVTNSWISSPAE